MGYLINSSHLDESSRKQIKWLCGASDAEIDECVTWISEASIPYPLTAIAGYVGKNERLPHDLLELKAFAKDVTANLPN